MLNKHDVAGVSPWEAGSVGAVVCGVPIYLQRDDTSVAQADRTEVWGQMSELYKLSSLH